MEDGCERGFRPFEKLPVWKVELKFFKNNLPIQMNEYF
jgi:hypothetical protein